METIIMRMNRRNVLVGLGTIVAGGGAALGTGAFSSVEAQRNVNVNVEGDGSGLLGLLSDDATYSQRSSTTDGMLELTFDDGDGSVGFNLNATTTFDPLFGVENNGGNSVGVYITSTASTETASVLDTGDTVIQNTITDDSSNTLTIEYRFSIDGSTIVGSGQAKTIAPIDDGGSTNNVKLDVGVDADSGFNLDDVNSSDYIQSVTITAE